MNKLTADPQAIADALRVILEPGQVTELRALDAVTAADRRPHVESGYFDDPRKLAEAIAGIIRAKGIYFIPNPVNPALLARAANRVRAAGREPTTADHDVIARRWLLIDCDPVRPAGISSSDAEHDAAHQRARAITAALREQGCPDPLAADSGNGFHLLYRVDLPADDGGLVQRCLEALAARFSDDVVSIDPKVFNPARIWKLYGTWACKGDHTAERPHRLSKLIYVPPTLSVVPHELLDKLAGSVSAVEAVPTSAKRPRRSASFDIETWINEHNLSVTGPVPWNGGRKWVFPVCPWNSDHTNGSAFILQLPSGAVAAGCHHNGCAGKDWHALRDAVEPDWRKAKATKTRKSNDDGGDNKPEHAARPSQADLLVEIVESESIELFHTPGMEGDGFATITVGDHRENWSVGSKGFKRWLCRRYWMLYRKAPGSQTLQDALGVIAGKALHDSPECRVGVRFLEQDGAIWLDLANETWCAVRVTANGWQVVHDPGAGVKFIRRAGMLPLPLPQRGGTVEELRPFVNVPDDDAWVLLVAWLVAALRPVGPYPVLAVNGEQGSAKSTLCRVVRSLIDPNIASLRRPPRDDRDLMIAAINGWVVAFDNLSGVPASLSDCLCTLATGGGFATRELYTDDSEKLFDAMRPVMLNGIDDLATRSDLLDRAVNLTLPVIPAEKRKNEADLWPRFDHARPRILGALLDAVSAALRNRASVHLSEKPRMADFATWATAAEPALGWQPGTFLRAYLSNRGEANTLAVEMAVLGPAVIGLMNLRTEWRGTAHELLTQLNTHHSDEQTRRRRDWPGSERKLSGDLRRLAPNLRRIGIEIIFGEREPGSGRRLIVIRKCPDSTVTIVTPAGNGGLEPGNRGAGVTMRDGVGEKPSMQSPIAAHCDGRDDLFPSQSNPLEPDGEDREEVTV